MKSKIISGMIATLYLFLSFAAGGGELAFRFAIFLLLPLFCIWFSDEMGSYTGAKFSDETPGCFVAFGGWLLLLLPIILGIIIALMS